MAIKRKENSTNLSISGRLPLIGPVVAGVAISTNGTLWYDKTKEEPDDWTIERVYRLVGLDIRVSDDVEEDFRYYGLQLTLIWFAFFIGGMPRPVAKHKKLPRTTNDKASKI